MKLKRFSKTVLVIFVLVLIIPALVFSANEKPVVKKGAAEMTVSGTLVHWKDMKKIDFSKMPTKRKLNLRLRSMFKNSRYRRLTYSTK